MANYQSSVHLTYQDVNGDTAKDRIDFGPLPDTTTLADLATLAGLYQDAIGGTGPNNAGSATSLTNAKLVHAALHVTTITAHVDPTATTGNRPIDAAFPSVQDRATLIFGADTGAKTRITIPAPMGRIFMAPPADDAVNLADTHVAALAALAIDVTNGLKDTSGAVYGFSLGGRRTMRSRKRRVNTNFVPSTAAV